MKLLNNYNVDIFNLKEGQHEYEFEAENNFFEYFENEVVKKGKLSIKAVLTKGSSVLSFDISTQGHVSLICDRSLNEFDYPLSLEHRLIFRFGEEDKELDDDLFQISSATHRVNLAASIYENLLVSLPMKKIHPDLIDDEEEGGEEEFDLVYSTGEFEEEEPEDENQSSDEPVDPRWEALMKLKNKEE